MPLKEKIQLQPIVEEMENSYLDYAMSVIVSRALPDVRDGLKPVHRRILFAMWDMGLKAGAKFRKSAAVVGETLAKYHPHGDAAVYDSLVRLAQDFAMRYPLVKGQGNWGSIDGDSAAAMRYTEAKLQPLTEEMLFDLDKDTIDFKDNYDGSKKEPTVLPAKLPNLLLNGTLGIAVGMATNIPPHNLAELCDALIYLVKDPKATVDNLMRYIKGPDFPTGGLVFDQSEIKKTYATGRGSIVMRAKAEILQTNSGAKIVINELPYQVNKAALIEKIAELVKEGKIRGIKGIRDESDRSGLRITIQLKKEGYPKKILNQLYKHTRLQDTFYVNMLALIDGIQPRILSLKMILEEYIKHRKQVIRRRTLFDLKNAKNQEHILSGLVMALEHIDRIIAVIKKSKNRNIAKHNLIKKFSFTIQQAEAILQMRLQALAGLERLKIEKELAQKRELMKELESILKTPEKVINIIVDDLQKLKKSYGDQRRTKIFQEPAGAFLKEDLIPKETAIIMITKDGYIKRLSPKSFKSQARGGQGVVGLTRKEQDAVQHLLCADTYSDLLFFTDAGRVFQLKTCDVPEASRTSRGQAVVNFLELEYKETITAVLALADVDMAKYLVMATQSGVIKKVGIKELSKVRRSGLRAIKLKTGDLLKWVKLSSGRQEIMLTTAQGMSIRFNEKGLRPMGRAARGVIGIKLSKGDQLVGMDIVEPKEINGFLLAISENGRGKMTNLKNYRTQSRSGKGIKTMQITSKTGALTSAQVVYPKNLPEDKKGDLILISKKGQVIRIKLSAVPIQGRATQGVRLMKLKKGKEDKVSQVVLV